MKIGNLVAKITNEWQKHNKWLDFEEELEPLGVIVARSHMDYETNWMWDVLLNCGTIKAYDERSLKVID